MFLCYPGESHSRGLMYGLQDLEEIDNRFAVNVAWTEDPEGPTSSYLRACKTFRNYQIDGHAVAARSIFSPVRKP